MHPGQIFTSKLSHYTNRYFYRTDIWHRGIGFLWIYKNTVSIWKKSFYWEWDDLDPTVEGYWGYWQLRDFKSRFVKILRSFFLNWLKFGGLFFVKWHLTHMLTSCVGPWSIISTYAAGWRHMSGPRVACLRINFPIVQEILIPRAGVNFYSTGI